VLTAWASCSSVFISSPVVAVSVLIATLRFNLGFCARYTTPCPPSPRTPVTWSRSMVVMLVSAVAPKRQQMRRP